MQSAHTYSLYLYCNCFDQTRRKNIDINITAVFFYNRAGNCFCAYAQSNPATA